MSDSLNTGSLLACIFEQIQRIQEREHYPLKEVLSYIPLEIQNDRMKMFRFLSAWNNIGRPPYEIVSEC